MDIKNIKIDFIVALWIAILLYLAGMTYLMIDVQQRLGCIEHHLAHRPK